jgi:hypothetical protein
VCHRRRAPPQLKGVDELRVPGRQGERLDVYAIARLGHQSHRTRLIEHTASPHWNEVRRCCGLGCGASSACGWC